MSCRKVWSLGTYPCSIRHYYHRQFPLSSLLSRFVEYWVRHPIKLAVFFLYLNPLSWRSVFTLAYLGPRGLKINGWGVRPCLRCRVLHQDHDLAVEIRHQIGSFWCQGGG